MTIEKFYETLDLISSLDRDLSLQTGLDSILNALVNLVNAPAQPQHQANLAAALSTFAEASRNLDERLTPATQSAIAEIGGAEFYDPALAPKIQASIGANAMTPTVARDFVQNISSRRVGYLTNIRQTLAGLTELGVQGNKIAAGTADMSFLIPRSIFDNELGEFAKELVFISRLVQDFTEATTGKNEPVVLEGLSSSVPTIGLIATIGVIASIAGVVNKFLDAWDKVLKFRKLRDDLKESGISQTALDEITESIEKVVTQVVEESTHLTLEHYPGDPGRKNELEVALMQGTRRLFGQIEQGLIVEFRAKPDGQANQEDQEALARVNDITRSLHYPEVAISPMLLTKGQLLEGDIAIASLSKKKTTTTTTTTATRRVKSPKTEG